MLARTAAVGAISSWAALPTAAWFQIIIFITFCEINFLKQDPNKEPGDVVPEGIPWARYPDGYDVWLGDGSTKQVGEDELILGRTWKLNAERNNGRAAMMGIIGMMIHEGLTGNPIWPIDYEPGHFPLIPLETVWPGIFSMGNPYPTA